MSNPVAMMLACGSIEPSLDFYYDGEHKTWWDVWGKWMFLGIGVLATIAACILAPFTCGGSVVGVGVAIGMTLAKIAAATVMGTVISLAVGGVIAGVQSALTGHGFWQGFAENVQGNFVDTLITSFTMAAVTVMLGNIIKFKQCFKEGTLIATEEGLKPIEEIREGDRVLAYDETTGEQGYKPVVQLFRNETNSWCTVSVKRESDGEACEITSTPGHKYYLPENEMYRDHGKRMENIGYANLSEKWVSAESLKCGDKVLLSDGTYGIIQSVRVSLLAVPETTYNFEVADYHTYYVGSYGVCVHNSQCGGDFKKYNAEEIAKRGDITVEQFHRSVKPEILKVAPRKLGKNPDILLNKQNIVGLQSRINGSTYNTGRSLSSFIKRR